MEDIDNPSGSQNEEVALPRFLTAATMTEQVILTHVTAHTGSAEEKAQFAHDFMHSFRGMQAMAQNYEFMSSMPDLADTEAFATAGQEFRQAIENPEVPEDIRAIYVGLYGEQLGIQPPAEISEA